MHTVASLLKLYLRDLPEPVVPWNQYEGFLLCGQLMNADEAKVCISFELVVLFWKKVLVIEHYSCRQATAGQGTHTLERDTMSNWNFVSNKRPLKPIIETALLGCDNPMQN